MGAQTGPTALQFEDRVLYELVELLGEGPLPPFNGASYGQLADRLGDVLRGHDRHQAEQIVWKAVRALDREGLVDDESTMGSSMVAPSRDGRRRVQEWRERWERDRQQQDRAVQRYILDDLDRQRRANPGRRHDEARVDVPALCAQLGVDVQAYLANAERLREQGKIAEHPVEQRTLMDGYASITEAGIRALETAASGDRPRRDAQEAWVEVARLKRELQLARRTLPSLITDPELRQRCEDLLTAGALYDRVVREACVVLEDRVRTVTGLPRATTGTPLMEQAFSPNGGPLQLSPDRNEQRGAMELYRGVIAFFRNVAGHHLSDTYTQDDALRFVAWIDLLLKMVAEVSAARPDSGTS